MKLTRTLLRDLKPGDRERWLADDQLPGFGVRVLPSGAATFAVRYRTAAGTPRRLALGDVRVLTLDQARERASAALVAVRDGRDPARDRRDPRRHATVADLAAEYQKVHRAPAIKPATESMYSLLWRRSILPHLSTRLVADLSPLDVQQLHVALSGTPYMANRALALLAQALTAAERWGWRPRGSNPCADVRHYREQHRQRILTQDEIGRLLALLDRLDADPRPTWSITWLVRLLLTTGLRCSEWSLARWDWVDLRAGTLTLPDSKTGGRVVHLSDSAVDLLRQLRRYRPHLTPWIIPAADLSGPLRHPQPHWGKIRRAAGLPDVRLHDLRHTVGSLGHMAGLSQRDIADLLGHRQMRTTERYLHGYDDRKRAAAEIAARAVLRLRDG